MKVIEFKSSNDIPYIVYIQHICSLSEDFKNKGTWIELSNGSKIHTNVNLKIFAEKIKNLG